MMHGRDEYHGYHSQQWWLLAISHPVAGDAEWDAELSCIATSFQSSLWWRWWLHDIRVTMDHDDHDEIWHAIMLSLWYDDPWYILIQCKTNIRSHIVGEPGSRRLQTSKGGLPLLLIHPQRKAVWSVDVTELNLLGVKKAHYQGHIIVDIG